MNDTNEIFEIATRYVQQTNRHVFLTGKAGTGKTTFLHQIKNNTNKKLAVLAPTGVAAINAGGSTIHSFFQLPFGMYLPDQSSVWGNNNNQLVYNKQQLLSNIKLSTNKRELIKELELLVIDEVSMVRSDLLDAIDIVLQSFRKKEGVPFGGVQMLFIGDMYQLPPILKDDEVLLHQKYYESPFFFDAKAMQQIDFKYIELTKIYRQDDSVFISLLNNIRNNDCTQEDIELLHSRYRPNFIPTDDKYITLTSHNYKAQNINALELQNINGNEEKFDAEITGTFPEHAYPTDFTIHLKLGAQVMFIKNDMGENKRYYNGKLAKVISFNKEEETITVMFEDSDATFKIERAEWKNVQYNYNKEENKIEEDVKGVFMQFPIKLAWAVTIHKSQGLTFQRAIIDAGDSFAAGQVYVALSRLTCFDGLILKSKINPNVIFTEPRIAAFSKKAQTINTLLNDLTTAQNEYAEYILLRTYDVEKLLNIIAINEQSYGSRNIPEIEYCVSWAKEMLDSIKEINQTAIQFNKQLNGLLANNNLNYTLIAERVNKASEWFVNNLETKLLHSCKEHIAKMKIMKRTIKYVKDITYIGTEISRKIGAVKSSVALAQGLAENKPIQDLLEASSKSVLNHPTFSAKSIKPAVKGNKNDKSITESTKHISLRMFKEGKSIEKIANERGFVTTTIEGHLSSFIATGEIKATDLVSQENLDVISKVLKEAPAETSLSEIKAMLGDEISYGAIRVVREWLRVQEKPE